MTVGPDTDAGQRPGGEVHTIVVVDDEPPIRKLLHALLERDERFAVVGEAGTLEDAVTVVAREQPHVLLLDLLMGGASGRDILPRVLVDAPETMVLVLSALSPEDEADAVFAAGAFAYLEKSVMGRDLPGEIAALHQRFRRALAGETVWGANDAGRILR